MPVTRRQFVHSSLIAGAGLLLNPLKALNNQSESLLFGINPFILQNPSAVFIMKTNVDVKTNSAAIKSVGLDFGRSVFALTDNAEEGIPLTHKVVIKPNLTCRQRDRDIYSRIGSMGIVTDAFFVEGVIESLKELSISAGQIFIREVNCPADFRDGGYDYMAERTGINLAGINIPYQNLDSSDIQWVSVPKGVWFKNIPYLWPVNSANSFLLNISKFKAHSMGLTLCAKNLQGTNVMNYQAHCTQFGNNMNGVAAEHISPTANADILASYNRHLKMGIPRWDRPGITGGLWQETWATRCLDNNSVTYAGLHIIEGIYGRDGNFLDGPDPQNLATDFMTNYIIFGRNQFYVDIIGHYIGGHEPGNFGLFHMALERGMISTINPMSIPVYEWNTNTGAMLADLSGFQRYPLKTCYLQKDYNGQNEPLWHMVDEPYHYSVTGIDDLQWNQNGFYFLQNFPNPVQNTTTISFHIPISRHVSLEILNSNSQIVDILVNKQLSTGDHVISWDSRNHPTGLYVCRLKSGTSVRTQKMMIIH